MQALIDGANRLRIHLSQEQVEAFRVYLESLVAERRSAALTSLAEPDAIQRRHFVESLALLRALEDAGALGARAIDIGTGAGFPGLPIKIARPALELTLLEATGKKAAFLERLVARLGLTGVTVVQARAEDLARDTSHRAAYDLALARAVAPLPALVEVALPFLRTGGYLAAPKGSGAPREVREAERALRECGGVVELVQPLDVPRPQKAPTLVLVRKVRETPDRFPRRAGIPFRRPLR